MRRAALQSNRQNAGAAETAAVPSDALRDLAGGGYADPNYVPPGTQPKKTTRHRVI
jgi:hypothetical protein